MPYVRETSSIVLPADDPALCDAIEATLNNWNWQCRIAGDPQTIAYLAARPAAAVILSPLSVAALQTIVAVRQMPAPANGTPVLQFGADGDSALRGITALLLQPFDATTFLAQLEQWAGPLDDHQLRQWPFSPRYRMIRLMGLDRASAIRARFTESLDATLGLSDDSITAADAHRLAGLAGMLGYSELAVAWAAIERGARTSLPQARALSDSVVAELRAD